MNSVYMSYGILIQLPVRSLNITFLRFLLIEIVKRERNYKHCGNGCNKNSSQLYKIFTTIFFLKTAESLNLCQGSS